LDFIDVRAIGNKLLRSTRYCARAFTLVEVAIAIVIVGVSSIALMQLAAVCAFQNRAASQATTAVLLAEHLREMLADLPLNDPTVGSTHFGAESGETLASYDDVDDFDGKTFQPVVDASRVALSGFEGFSQSVVVNPVNTTQLNGNLDGAAISKSTYTGAVRVTINVNVVDPITGTASTIYSINSIRVEE
jgi:prepilin-type N-terminal cleavage/methylation domain-containing protein